MNSCQYDMFKAFQAEYIKKIKSYVDHGWKVVVYGAGMYGKKMLHMLKENGIIVERITVTKVEYNKQELEGKKVYALDELVKENEKYVYLLAIKPSSQILLEKELQNRNVDSYIKLPKHAEAMLDDTFLRPVLEITARIGCSVNCHFCPQSLLIKKYCSDKSRSREMKLEDFKYYIDKIPNECIIDFSGFVEPFLAKDGVAMVKYAYESGHDVRLFTTLVGLSLEKFKEIENIPFKLVVLHLPDVKGYANIPITDDYKELLRYIVSAKRSDGSSFVDFANCQCEPHPDIVEIIGNEMMISWDMIDRAGNIEDKAVRSVGTIEGDIYCSRALYLNHNVLLPDGEMVICCMDYGLQRVLGNLREQNYEEIIGGKVLKKIKFDNSKKGDVLCRHCTYAKKI